MKSVFTFDDYRKFLSAFYAHEKAGKSGYTYARFSARAGLNAPNFLKVVISGSRNLTVANIHKFAVAVGLTPAERDYFEALVLRDQAASRDEREFYGRRLKSLRAVRPKNSAVRTGRAADALSGPFVLAILVGMHEKTIEEGVRFLKAQINRPEAEVRSEVDRFVRLGLLRREADGKHFAAYDHVLFRDEASSRFDHKNYLASQIDLSRLALRSGYEKGACFYSQTFTLSPSAFKEFSDLIQDFFETLAARAEDGANTEIVQVNAQFFPIRLATRIERGARDF